MKSGNISYVAYLHVKKSFRGLPFYFTDIEEVEIKRSVNEAPPEDWEFKELYLNQNKGMFTTNQVKFILDGVRKINDRPIKNEQNPIGT